MLLRTRLQYPAGPIEVFVHQGLFNWDRGDLEQNWRYRIVQLRKDEINRRFYNLTKLTVFASLLKEIPLARKDAALQTFCCKITQLTVPQRRKLQGSLIKTFSVFCALALQFHGNQWSDEKVFGKFLLLINKKDEVMPISSKVSTWKIFLLVRICIFSIFCYKI